MGVLVFGPAQVKVEADPQELLEHLDTPALLKPTLTGTLPSDDRMEYLACVDELNESIQFLEKHAGKLSCCKEELENGRQVMDEAMRRLQGDFGTLLATSSVSLDKGRHFSILSRRTASGNLAADAAAAGLPQQQPPDMAAAGHGSGGSGSCDDHHYLSLMHGQTALALLAQPEAMEDLASVCARLASNGAAATCKEVYLKQRREWQDKTMEAMEMLQLLGVDVMTMAWDKLEEAMTTWNEHLKMVERLTVMEADLAYRVLHPLDSSGAAAKHCVARLALQWLHPLAVFGRVVAESKKTPEKLVPLLDMVESLTDVQPGILLAVEGAPEQDLSEVKNALAVVEQTLKQSAQQTAYEFTRVIETDDVGGTNSHSQQQQQSSQQATNQQQQQQQAAQQQQQEDNQEQQQQQQQWLQKIPTKTNLFRLIRGRNVQRLEEAAKEATSPAFTAVPGDGDVLKIVRYVSNFVWLLGHKEYVSMLRDVMGSEGAVRRWMVATMTALEKNLSMKANTIQDERLRELFLMNNYNYIVCKLDGQEVEDLLSEDWWDGMKQALERHRDKYIEIITNKFDQVLGSGTSDAIGFWKRLQAFNVAFDELCQRQRSWCIPNAELCCLIRFEVANIIDLRYKDFIDAHRSVIDSTRRPKAKIHTLTDLGSRLRESFPVKTKGPPKLLEGV